MNEFEKKLYADLQAGNSVDDLMAEFKRRLDVADKEYKAAQEKARADADAQKSRAAKAKTITDLANRLLEDKPSADDVAYVFQRYFASKWNKSDAVTQQVMTAAEVDEMTETAVKMFNALEPLVKAVGMTWEDVTKDVVKAKAKTQVKVSVPQSEDEAIRDFIQKIM